MAIAAIFDYGTPPDDSALQQRREGYDRVNRELGGGQAPETASDMADGLLAHFVGETQDGRGIIVNVFESQEAMDRLMERLTRIMQEMDRPQPPEPRVEILTLRNVLT
jgi:hypothetical protein